MAAAAEQLKQPISADQRFLSEVYLLNQNRLPDGSYPEEVRRDILVNLKTATLEAAVPHAVSTTRYEYEPTSDRTGVFKWMGKTAVENAMSGYRFYEADAARRRVDVEVDEARHLEEEHSPDVMKFLISPRMTRKDADIQTAKEALLADDDSIRATWLETNPDGSIKECVMQSLLVRDIPLESWVAMLEDPNSIFGKSITVADPDSALSVMQVHRELQIPLEAAPDGPVDLVRAVLPYIEDELTREKVANQITLFESDQDKIDMYATNIAERWLQFEEELATSLEAGNATLEIKRFIVNLQHDWSEEDLEVLRGHEYGEDYFVSEELAVLLEKAKRNILWASAGVITGNKKVLQQMDKETAWQIYQNEVELQAVSGNIWQMRELEARNNRLVASQNVETGGGCATGAGSVFGENMGGSGSENNENSDAESSWTWKPGVCRVEACSTRPGSTLVGPCSVCKDCQHAFDRGEDPTKGKVVEMKTESVSLINYDEIYKFLKRAEGKKGSDRELQPA